MDKGRDLGDISYMDEPLGEPKVAKDANADASNKPPFLTSHVPRLGIVHLLLWTLCSAVYLSFVRAFDGLDIPSSVPSANFRYALIVLRAAVVGAVFCGAITLVATRIRSGSPMLRHPGHWILFIKACSHVMYLPLYAVQLMNQDYEVLLLVYGLSLCFPPIAIAFAVRHHRILHWRAFFVGHVLVATTQCVPFVVMGLRGYLGMLTSSWSVFFAIASAGSLLLAVVILVISVVELLSGNKRDWLHWMGVIAYVAVPIIGLSFRLFMSLLSPSLYGQF